MVATVNGRIFQSVLRRVAILLKPEPEFVITLPQVLVVEIAESWVQILTQSFVTPSHAQSTEIILIGRNFLLVLNLVEIAPDFDDDFAQTQLLVMEVKIVPYLERILKRLRVTKLHAPFMEISLCGPNFQGVLRHVETVLENGTEIVLVRHRCMVGTTVRPLASASKL